MTLRYILQMLQIVGVIKVSTDVLSKGANLEKRESLWKNKMDFLCDFYFISLSIQWKYLI